MKRSLCLVLTFACILLALTGCSRAVDEAQYIGTIFDGQAVLRAYGKNSQLALTSAFSQMQIAQKDTLEENGDFTLMYAAQNQMHEVSPFTTALLSHVQTYQSDYAEIYAQAQKKSADYQYCFTAMQLEPAVNTASLQCDSSSYLKMLARAAALDNAAQTMLDEGADCGMVMLDGAAVTMGKRPDNGAWAMPVTHPLDSNMLIGTLYLKNLCANTMTAPLPERETGDTTERALSVTIIAPTTLEATVLSCFLYGLDVQYAFNMINALDDIDALLLGEDGTVLATQAVSTPNAYV